MYSVSVTMYLVICLCEFMYVMRASYGIPMVLTIFWLKQGIGYAYVTVDFICIG